MKKKIITILIFIFLIINIISGTAKIIDEKDKKLISNTIILTQDVSLFDTIQKPLETFNINNVNPMASFEWTPAKPKTNEIIQLNASFSYDPDGTLTEYSWDWNDDGIYDKTLTIPTINHSWSNSGDYQVTLKVTNDQGSSGTVSRVVFIVDEWNIIVPDDYITIQEAIDNSNNGDRIFVRAGTYNGDIIINKKMLIIHGENVQNTNIIGSGNEGVIWITDNAFNINISGFTISNSNPYDSGIYLGSDYNIIEENIIRGNGVGVEIGRSSRNQVKNNLIIDNSMGIFLNDNSHSNNIEKNTVKSNSGNGILIAYLSTGNNIHNCTIQDNEDSGIYITEVGKGNTITWNTLKGNNIGVNCDVISDGNLYHHNSLVENNINAFDGSVNSWNSVMTGGYDKILLQGNYWSDYDGIDMDSDGIGDTPYVIPGGNNKDNYPLMNPPFFRLYDVAGLHMYFSTMEADINRAYEIPELVDGDEVFFTTWWDVIPDHYMSEWEYYNVEYEYWLDGIKYDHWLGWEHQVDPYEWRPDILAYAYCEWQHDRWTATQGNHSFKAIFDPYDTWDEGNEGNNEIIVNFYVHRADEIVAGFNWQPEKPEINELVKFDATESYTPNGEIIKYEWDWNNDGIYDESLVTPRITHSWSNSGTYNVTLNIINNNDENDIITRAIIVVNKRVIFVPEDYNTIQDAVDNADEGIIIQVEPGIYRENIFINKSVRIFGEDKEATIIDGDGLENHIIRIDADNVEIGGLTIMNCDVAYSGIRVYGNYSIIHNNIIANCGGGVELFWTTDNYIGSNKFINNLWGIFVSGSSNCEIEYNLIIENNYGIEMGSSNAFIISNTIENNNEHGIFLIDTISVFLDSNNCINNGGAGIRLFDSSYTEIFDNEIRDNKIDGICIHKSTNNKIYENFIVDNENHPISCWYFSDKNYIENNYIESRELLGVYIEYSKNNVLKYNKFSNNNGITENNLGIQLVRSSNNNLIYHNNFFNNYYAYDECDNFWDNGSLFCGNYWDNYDGMDIDDDGIGDLPNNIKGGGRQDHYPFVYEWDPPEKPTTPLGTQEGRIRKEYSYQTSTADLKGDRIQYGWDWDSDYDIDEWTGFYNSGVTVTTNHKWNKQGDYNIHVIARDEKNQISEWSDSLVISMPKQKLTLSIDKEIISQAKNQNINLSSFLEIRLIDHLSDKEKCSRRDSNPSGWLERPE